MSLKDQHQHIQGVEHCDQKLLKINETFKGPENAESLRATTMETVPKLAEADSMGGYEKAQVNSKVTSESTYSFSQSARNSIFPQECTSPKTLEGLDPHSLN